MTDHPTLRFNSRLRPHHLAFLLDPNRNGSGRIRRALDEEIKRSDVDLDNLREAATTVARHSEAPREEFSELASTDDVFDRAVEIAPDESFDELAAAEHAGSQQGVDQ